MPFNDILPAQCTHPALQTLALVVHGMQDPPVFPLRVFFTALHLPALRTLTLSVPGTRAWTEGRALSELYIALASTPGITKLVLEADTDAAPRLSTPASDAAEPVWVRAPHLAHVQLSLPKEAMPRRARCTQVFAFVRRVFTEHTWLDLRHAACPIRTVTISNAGRFFWKPKYKRASVAEAALVPHVSLGFTQETMWSVAQDVLKEWGSRM